MFDDSAEHIARMKAQISYSAQKIIWARQKIAPELLAFHYSKEMLADFWREADTHAAQNLFEMINDGELYCLRVKRVGHNLDMAEILAAADFWTTAYSLVPEISIGYEGSLHRVRREIFTAPVVEMSPMWLPTLPTWTQIGQGIGRRLREDFRPNNLVRWFVKNVLAAVLYLPEENPKYWGMNAW